LRPVNLIPKEERRGERSLGGRSGGAVYAVLGLLGAAVIAVLLLVLTSNSIIDRKDRVADLTKKQATAETEAEALQPYDNFVQLQTKRMETVNSLVDSAFNWERVIRSLSRAIPSDTWLVSFKGTVAPTVDLDSSSGGVAAGSLAGARSTATAPAIELIGCTYSHRDVARMMVRMRNLDHVSDVVLGKSERPESRATGAASGQDTSGGECRTKYSVTKFEMLVVLGEAAAQPVAPDSGGSTASATAQAQGAATSPATQGASSGAGSGQ
jgi:Tfp pilus assembly protein PilN